MAVAPYMCVLLSHNLNKNGAPQHCMHNFLLFACISVGETHLIATLLRVFLLPLDLHFFRGRGYEENRKVKAPSFDGFMNHSQSLRLRPLTLTRPHLECSG